MIYLLMFIFSSVIIFAFENEGKVMRRIGLCIGIFAPVVLATIRAETVGIDVATYMKPLYLCAKDSQNISAFFSNAAANEDIKFMEKGYALLGYLTTKITGGLWGLFLANELLCIVPILFAVRECNNYISGSADYNLKIPYAFVLFVWLCIFYNNSLNQVRQLIGCSLILLAMMKLINKKYAVAILLWVIAYVIHSSALIMICFVVLYFIAKSNSRILFALALVLIAVFALFSVQIFYAAMIILDKLNILSEKFSGEVFGGTYEEINLNLSWMVISVAMLAFSIYNLICYHESALFKYLFLIAITTMSLFGFSSRFANFGRLQLYCLIYVILILPMRQERKFTGLNLLQSVWLVNLKIIIPIAYWIVSVYLFDYTGTIPYLIAV